MSRVKHLFWKVSLFFKISVMSIDVPLVFSQFSTRIKVFHPHLF